MGYMIGVDAGGTFTDSFVFDSETKRLSHCRHSSTSDDPSCSIVSGAHYILGSEGIDPAMVEYLAYGTTVATNALIEKRGAHMGLITTKGFKGLMEIGNQKRPPLYDLSKEKPESLIPSGLKCEVEERLLHDGPVKISLNEEDVRKAARLFQEQNATTIAICTLFSFINPAHERRIKEIILEECPEAYVSTSSELVSEPRGHSYMSTAVLNAYPGPVVKKYVENFQSSVREPGIAVAPYVTQSNGSTTSIAETVEYPVRTAVSSPSAGVVGVIYIDHRRGIDKIITFDMDGISVGISLIKDSKAQVLYERMVEGYPARIPMIDIITVGAGGGSIAAIDEGDALRVGPRSADAVSGPVCYMRGGENPTVTDVNILLGELNRHKILGGRMSADWNLAYDTIQKKTSGKSSLSVEDAAVGIIPVVSSDTVRVIRVVSVEHGYDAREFMLVAFGGTDLLHAREVVKELGTTQVLLPSAPGMLCSLGLLMADTRFDPSQSYIMIAASQNLSEMNRIFSQLIEEGDKMLENEDIAKEGRTLFYLLDCRYEHQNYKITVELPTGEIIEEVLSGLVEQFYQEYKRSYGYYDKKKNAQTVNYRVGAIGITDKLNPSGHPVEENPQVPTPVEVRKVWFEGSPEYLDTNIYQHTQLPCGCTVSGPAIIEQMDSTSIILSGWQAHNDLFLNLIVTYHGGETT